MATPGPAGFQLFFMVVGRERGSLEKGAWLWDPPGYGTGMIECNAPVFIAALYPWWCCVREGMRKKLKAWFCPGDAYKLYIVHLHELPR